MRVELDLGSPPPRRPLVLFALDQDQLFHCAGDFQEKWLLRLPRKMLRQFTARSGFFPQGFLTHRLAPLTPFSTTVIYRVAYNTS